MSQAPDPRMQTEKVPPDRFAAGVVVASLTIIAGSLAAYAWTFGLELSGWHADWGTLGDFLAGVSGAAVSLAALFLLFRTYTVQREELRETKKALREAADAQERTATEMGRQADATVRAAKAQIRHLRVAQKQLELALAGSAPRLVASVKSYPQPSGLVNHRLVVRNYGAMSPEVSYLTSSGGWTVIRDNAHPAPLGTGDVWKAWIHQADAQPGSDVSFALYFVRADGSDIDGCGWRISPDGTIVSSDWYLAALVGFKKQHGR